MKITPIGGKIQIDIAESTAGALETSSLNTAREKGIVVALGKTAAEIFPDLKKGDAVYFKAWAVDIINDEGKKCYFIDVDSKGLCAIVK